MGALSELLKLTGKRAGIGAAAGAGTGAAVSEGDPSATIHGGIWGTLGGLTGHGLYEGAGALGKLAAMTRSPKSRARGMLLSRMEGDEIPISEMRGRIAQSRAGVDPLFTLGDMEMLSGAEMAALQPGGARTIAKKFYDDFIENQDQRVMNAVSAEMGSNPEAFKTVKALQDLKKATATPLYEEAYKVTGISDPELSALLKRAEDIGAFKKMELIRDADPDMPQTMPVRKVIKDPEGNRPDRVQYTLDTSHADLIKRGLDQMIAEHSDDLTGKTDDVGRAVTKLKKSILGKLDVINPTYGKARAAFSDLAQSQNAVNMGQKFMGSKIDDMDNWLERFDNLDEADKDFFRVGVAQSIKNRILSGREGHDAVKQFFKTKAHREKLKAIFPDEKSFNRFEDSMDREMRISGSKNVVLGGSPTVKRTIEQARLQKEDLNLLGDASHLVRGNPLPLIGSILTRIKQAGIGPKTAKELMKMLVSTDKAGNMTLMDELASLQKRRKALTSSNKAAGAAAAGGAGALAGYSEGTDIPVGKIP